MSRCWNDEPTDRPTFDHLVALIDDVISKARPSAARADDSRLYLNVAHFDSSAAEQAPHQMADSSGASGSPDALINDDVQGDEELRYR